MITSYRCGQEAHILICIIPNALDIFLGHCSFFAKKTTAQS